jgi:hypothetical protein
MPAAARRQGRQLSKLDLVSRLDRRSRDRYGGEFKESWLNDLVKDGLVPGLEYLENQGGDAPILQHAFIIGVLCR